uniref:Uncharacterized protein n=1 Tax=Arundo donax TaxID=35708 RepID=A0A0A9GGL5_ARUDO
MMIQISTGLSTQAYATDTSSVFCQIHAPIEMPKKGGREWKGPSIT